MFHPPLLYFWIAFDEPKYLLKDSFLNNFFLKILKTKLKSLNITKYWDWIRRQKLKRKLKMWERENWVLLIWISCKVKSCIIIMHTKNNFWFLFRNDKIKRRNISYMKIMKENLDYSNSNWNTNAIIIINYL